MKTHSYIVTGMSCGHCAARVKKTLEEHPAVESAEVTLEPPKAIVTLRKDVSISDLNKQIEKAGAYHLDAVAAIH